VKYSVCRTCAGCQFRWIELPLWDFVAQVVYCVKHYTPVAVTFGVFISEVDIALNVSAGTSAAKHAWFGILFLACMNY